MSLHYPVVLEPGEDGWVIASVPFPRAYQRRCTG